MKDLTKIILTPSYSFLIGWAEPGSVKRVSFISVLNYETTERIYNRKNNVGQPVNPIIGMSSSSPDIQIKQQTPVAGGKKHPYNS